MRNKRRMGAGTTPDLFSCLESSNQKAQRVHESGNYATRTVRKWIRGDPFTLAACQEMSEGVRKMPVVDYATKRQAKTLRLATLTLQLALWFRRAVREEEPSAAYADYLCGSIDVEWGILAEELFAGEWAENGSCPLHNLCRGDFNWRDPSRLKSGCHSHNTVRDGRSIHFISPPARQQERFVF